MIRDEKRLLRYMDWGIYLIFVPIMLALIPTNRLLEKDPYFFALMMLYVAVIHFINRRFNFVTYLFRGRYKRAAATIALIVLLTYITSLIKVEDLRGDYSAFSKDEIRLMRNRVLFTLCFVDFCFSVMLALLLELFRQKFERQTIEAEKGKAELALYKSQINPHFMFNTLNTIYALNLTGSPLTSEVIMKFSNIVKYMYQNTDKERIMISEEVKYLQEFIDLHAMRLSEETCVNFEHEIDDGSEYIPSMILVTFVENLFKYGVSSSHRSTIDITLKLRRKELLFATSNTVFSRGERGGIGIENCRKRLSLLYPGHYHLECGEGADNIYRTTLTISL